MILAGGVVVSDLVVAVRESGELRTTTREPFLLEARALPALDIPTAALEDDQLFTTVEPR